MTHLTLMSKPLVTIIDKENILFIHTTKKKQLSVMSLNSPYVSISTSMNATKK